MNYENLIVSLKAVATPELTEDIKSLIVKLEKQRDDYLNQLLDTRHKLIQKDYLVENQSNVIENTRKTLESYERENKHLRGLVKEWI